MATKTRKPRVHWEFKIKRLCNGYGVRMFCGDFIFTHSWYPTEAEAIVAMKEVDLATNKKRSK
jgi:hypothetical protein